MMEKAEKKTGKDWPQMTTRKIRRWKPLSPLGIKTMLFLIRGV